MRTYQNRMAEEINRLKHLSTINPLISKDEVVAAETKLKKGLTALKSTQPRLDSIRLILFQK